MVLPCQHWKPSNEETMQVSKRIWKILFVTVILATAGTAVYGIFLANFIVPSTVNITGAPGIQVLDGVLGGVLTSLTWGDVQQTTSSTHLIYLKNTGQSQVWFLDGTVQSLTTNPALPTGVTLTWNLVQLFGIQQCSTMSGVIGSGITACLPLAPGTQSTGITLTLSVSASAAQGQVSFTTVFSAYSTPIG